jgi:hypothetical protein
VSGGLYAKRQDLALTTPFAPPVAVIRYTLDGATPTNASPVYTSPIHIDATTVVRASTLFTGYLPSTVINHTYLIGNDTALPIVSMMTDPENLWDPERGIYVDQDISLRKEWERPVYLQFFESDRSLGFETDASIRLFGHTAVELPQKSFAVFIRKDGGRGTIHYPLFPQDPFDQFSSFLLRSSSDDWNKTMFRDAMAQGILDEHFALDTQRYRPAVLFINGEYFGIYNIRDKYNELHLAAKYDISPDDIDLLNIDTNTADGKKTITALHGSSEDYEELLDFVRSHDLRLPENYAFVRNRIDVDNLIDYVIAEIYVGNASWFRNRKVWRGDAAFEKWRFLLYDLDRSFDDPSTNELENLINGDVLFRALLENAEFRNEFLWRFANHLNTAFKPPRITALIDDLRAGIALEMPQHIARWKGECNGSVCGIQSMDGWEVEIQAMTEFARQRPMQIWQHLAEQFGSDGTRELELAIVEPEGGAVLINGLAVSESGFTYTHLARIPLELAALPNEGYDFLGWRGCAQETGPITLVLATDCTLTAMFAPTERPDAAYGNYVLAGLLVLSVSVSVTAFRVSVWLGRIAER